MMRQCKRQTVGIALAAMLLVVVGFGPWPAAQTQGVPFSYQGRKYVMDQFAALFDTASRIGSVRLALFTAYLKSSAEGRARVKASGSANPETVWRAMGDEERTTFLAVTAALGRLEEKAGVDLLNWVVSVEEIRGGGPPGGGTGYDKDKAFRLYARMSPAAIAHVRAEKGRFTNLCNTTSFGYGGYGSRHRDFCLLPRQVDFEHESKTSNSPNLQFNVSSSNTCADIDLDFDRGLDHFSKDNSNVLGHIPDGHDHLASFSKAYCDPGFR